RRPEPGPPSRVVGGAPGDRGGLLTQPIWRPADEAAETSRLRDYERWLAAERGLSFDDYHALWGWSVSELEQFWASIWAPFGVERGDRVAAYLPNLPETAAAFFACASIGAIWSSCSPDFGVRSVVHRFAQIEPKVLLAVDGYRYNGRDFDRGDELAAIRAELP